MIGLALRLVELMTPVQRAPDVPGALKVTGPGGFGENTAAAGLEVAMTALVLTSTGWVRMIWTMSSSR